MKNLNAQKIVMDWKDKLAALLPEDMPVEEVHDEPVEQEEVPVKGQVLCLQFQRRAGKPATIISGWQGSDEGLKALAKKMKVALATGGSVRDDEILMQGDVRDKVRVFLQKNGYKYKGG